jgi:hypothetical protein
MNSIDALCSGGPPLTAPRLSFGNAFTPANHVLPQRIHFAFSGALMAPRALGRLASTQVASDSSNGKRHQPFFRNVSESMRNNYRQGITIGLAAT